MDPYAVSGDPFVYRGYAGGDFGPYGGYDGPNGGYIAYIPGYGFNPEYTGFDPSATEGYYGLYGGCAGYGYTYDAIGYGSTGIGAGIG